MPKNPGLTVVVFGAGPVGPFAARSAWLMGACSVISVDHLDYWLELAERFAQAQTVNFTRHDDVAMHLKLRTDFLGAEVCIDAVGAEADGSLLQRASASKHDPRERSPAHQFLTPVFGATRPPRGLSDAVRRYAYRWSEGRAAHGLLLLAADRIDVLESRARGPASHRC